MRILVVATLVLLTTCLFPGGLGAPGNGTDLTAQADTWYIHADPDSDPWMSNTKEDGSADHYGGYGLGAPSVAPPGLGSFTFDFPLEPGLSRDVQVDTEADIEMQVHFGGGDGGYVVVTPEILVDGQSFALGEPLEGYYYLGGVATFTWTLTPGLDTLPAGADIVWNLKAAGALANGFFLMQGDTWTQVRIPVIPGEDLEGQDPGAQASNTTTTAPATTTTTTTSRPATTTTTGPATTTAPPTTATDTGEPVNDVDADSQESPGAAPLLLLAALAGVGIVRRKL